MAVVAAGVVLTVLLDYPRSPTALFGPPIRAPYGVRPYAEYLAATSAVPFAAIASGRQRFVLREISAWTVVIGVAVAVALRLAHDDIFARHGLWFLAAVFAGAALSTLQSWRRARRQGTLASVTR